jgi:DNA-binding GntR family transcriptional regulator
LLVRFSNPLSNRNLGRVIVEHFRSARDLKSWIELDNRFHRSLPDASGLTTPEGVPRQRQGQRAWRAVARS